MGIRDFVEVDFECGKGWDSIIEPLVRYVQHYNETHKKKKIDIVQIKEKFGGLRFYTHGTTKKLDAMVQAAENKAYQTCELCGSKEDIGQTADGWITTCCRKCVQAMANKAKANRKWYSHNDKEVKEIKYEN